MASSLQNIKDKVVYKFLEFFVFGLSLMIPSVQKYMADQIDGKLHTSLVLVKKELDEQWHHLTWNQHNFGHKEMFQLGKVLYDKYIVNPLLYLNYETV